MEDPVETSKEESGKAGYSKRLFHDEIGKGLNDYDTIFTELKKAWFDGWISIKMVSTDSRNWNGASFF